LVIRTKTKEKAEETVHRFDRSEKLQLLGTLAVGLMLRTSCCERKGEKRMKRWTTLRKQKV
jgi:hypothetical protein